jgi:hypothetical protein
MEVRSALPEWATVFARSWLPYKLAYTAAASLDGL